MRLPVCLLVAFALNASEHVASIVPIWVHRPQTLGVSTGGHRYVWGFSDRTVPGDFTVELTVDGKAVTKKLKVVPDPRSKERR